MCLESWYVLVCILIYCVRIQRMEFLVYAEFAEISGEVLNLID